MRIQLFALLLLFAALQAMGQDKSHSSAGAAARMRAAAERLLTALPERERAAMLRPFDDRDRVDWHYTPRSRNGVSLRELDGGAREAVHALLRQALSAAGHSKVVNIIELELVLREIETFGLMRDPQKYSVVFFGTPHASTPWGWRFEGHHLSLSFTLRGDAAVATSPSFMGANPAEVP